jgi:hypothetical protein
MDGIGAGDLAVGNVFGVFGVILGSLLGSSQTERVLGGIGLGCSFAGVGIVVRRLIVKRISKSSAVKI